MLDLVGTSVFAALSNVCRAGAEARADAEDAAFDPRVEAIALEVGLTIVVVGTLFALIVLVFDAAALRITLLGANDSWGCLAAICQAMPQQSVFSHCFTLLAWHSTQVLVTLYGLRPSCKGGAIKDAHSDTGSADGPAS